MHQVLLLGAGKIGRMIAFLLARSGHYHVVVADSSAEALTETQALAPVETLLLDISQDPPGLARAMQGKQCVISALAFHANPTVARAALQARCSYFDLTEDNATTAAVRQIAASAAPGQIFMPQCGLAPGFISILANDLLREFDSLDTVHLRVGALPQFPSNTMKYNLTWSTVGLINEYCNPCHAVHFGKRIDVLPLEGLEHFSLDGVHYEAFNTSGGLGTLCETLEGKVRELNYKTCRYRGHRELMQFLISELRLGERRDLLLEILERAIPITYQDVVVVYVSITGRQGDRLVQASNARKIYHQQIHGKPWSAIQITTAAGLCAAVDLHLTGHLPEQGFVRQEQVPLDKFFANRFGTFLDHTAQSQFVKEVTGFVPTT